MKKEVDLPKPHIHVTLLYWRHVLQMPAIKTIKVTLYSAHQLNVIFSIPAAYHRQELKPDLLKNWTPIILVEDKNHRNGRKNSFSVTKSGSLSQFSWLKIWDHALSCTAFTFIESRGVFQGLSSIETTCQWGLQEQRTFFLTSHEKLKLSQALGRISAGGRSVL